MTSPAPIVCGVDPWPVLVSCLPPLFDPPEGDGIGGLYPGFIPGPTAFPGEGVLDGAGGDGFTLGSPRDDADPGDVLRLRVAIRAAVATLSALLGHRYVVRCVTVRPCSSGPRAGGLGGPRPTGDGGWWIAYQDGNGGWHNFDPCTAGRCDPLGRGAVELPTRWGTVREVTRVEVDGAVIANTGYALESVRGRAILYRTGVDGCGGAWPTQDLGLPLGCPGTWAATLKAGTPPPPGTALHVSTLATEFYNLCGDAEDTDCRIPRDWVSVSRDGVTVSRVDPSVMLAQRLTGLAEVDAWIRAHNPHRLVSPVTVAGPGTLRGVL